MSSPQTATQSITGLGPWLALLLALNACGVSGCGEARPSGTSKLKTGGTAELSEAPRFVPDLPRAAGPTVLQVVSTAPDRAAGPSTLSSGENARQRGAVFLADGIRRLPPVDETGPEAERSSSPVASSGPTAAAPQALVVITGPDGELLSQIWDISRPDPEPIADLADLPDSCVSPEEAHEDEEDIEHVEDEDIEDAEESAETSSTESGLTEPQTPPVYGGRYALEQWDGRPAAGTSELLDPALAPSDDTEPPAPSGPLPESPGAPQRTATPQPPPASNEAALEENTPTVLEDAPLDASSLPDESVEAPGELAMDSQSALPPDPDTLEAQEETFEPTDDSQAAIIPIAEAPADTVAEPQTPLVVPEPRQEPPPTAPRIVGLLLHATQAHHHVQQGFGAANRGMLYTARKEFLQALRIIAEAKDARLGHRASMDALAAGLAAVEEAERIRDVSSAGAETDLSLIIATHRTPVLKGQDVSDMLPLAAIDRYHEYAQQQLGRAVAGDPSGSMALYGLARIYEHLGSENGADRVARSRQSVAFHEAALLAHPENPLAAHELGVVLARLGRYEDAVAMLTRSVQLAPSSNAYQNLAVASRHCGRHAEAALAERYASQMAGHEAAMGQLDHRVVWLDPTEFARTSEGTTAAQGGAPPTAQASAPPERTPPDDGRPPAERRAWWKLPLWR